MWCSCIGLQSYHGQLNRNLSSRYIIGRGHVPRLLCPCVVNRVERCQFPCPCINKQHGGRRLTSFVREADLCNSIVTFSPCLNPIISSITTGLPRFFISIPHPLADYVYDLEASSSTIQGLVSLYFSIGDPRTIIIVRLHRYLVRYNLSTDTY